MLNITITESTPANMLRAIRAACNELLGETHADLTTQAAGHVTRANELQAAADAEAHKAAAALSAHNAAEPVPSEERVAALDEAAASYIADQRAEELDSAGQPWSAEIHSSSRTKIADGTWKKRRVTAAAQPTTAQEATEQIAAAPAAPPLQPAPSAPVVTMNDIYALVTSGKKTINDVIALAQDVGFADVGAFSREATPEQRAEMLRKLEGA